MNCCFAVIDDKGYYDGDNDGNCSMATLIAMIMFIAIIQLL